MKGQDDADPSKKSYDADSYNSKTPFQRIIISLAGPLANFLLAFLLYFAVASMGVPSPLAHIGAVMKSSPAEEAGVKQNDKIVNINGHTIHYWQDIGLNLKHDRKNSITVVRNSEYVDLNIAPKLLETKNRFGETTKRYLLGISPKMSATEVRSFSLQEEISFAYEQTKRASLYIAQSLKKLVTGSVPMENLGGVVSIVDSTSKVSQLGIVALLMFAALISVNLGVINLLPIPALDGGHIMFHLYELIRKKPASDEVMFKLTLFGWAILLSLMLLGFYNDLNRLFG
jgi:regulator of sigma E protease